MAKETTSTRCWNKFRVESVCALCSPLFVSFATGTLDAESFRRSVSHDLHFFNASAQAYELAADCVENDDDKKAIGDLRKSALQNFQMTDLLATVCSPMISTFLIFKSAGQNLPFDDILAQALRGIEGLNDSISNATVKYRDFLLAIASGKVEDIQVPIKITTPFEKTKVAAYTLGVIAPCMRFYADVYREIQAPIDTPDPRPYHGYKKWIENYTSQDFLASTIETEDLLDKLSTSLTEEELNEIENLYHQALKLQVEFFAAQPISQQTVVPLSRAQELKNRKLTIFCNFDLTCSVVHSTAALEDAAFSKFQLVKKTWDDLSAQHVEEVEKCLNNVNSGMLPGPEKKYDYDGLRKKLEQVAEVEKNANARVEESGILNGLTLETIKLVGNHIVLHDGCRRFFQKIVKKGRSIIDVHVISHCWSSQLIRSAFSSGSDVLNVHSNELAYVATGEILKKVESAPEKLRSFNEVLKDRKSDVGHLTVCIGRDISDFLCLLEADIGIVINPSPRLTKLGLQFAVKFGPLFPTLVKMQKDLAKDSSSIWKPSPGTIYVVSSWTEIEAFIFGL
ncbi:hypothetical protein L484_015885 [Morus notabilis]|uniref:Thiaminase-2/PQQC domain-containing protein n=1 Tax=Morus notabilis TaxID=981085 RepID=W9QZM2_9ROSA|nr:bifunctional TH2 protein, mitochondrial [Morus notabilis]EXB46024.1 hypothetical protein L484_015885 [Morus notabilis]